MSGEKFDKEGPVSGISNECRFGVSILEQLICYSFKLCGRREEGTGVGVGSKPCRRKKSGLTCFRERESQMVFNKPGTCLEVNSILWFKRVRMRGRRRDMIKGSLLVLLLITWTMARLSVWNTKRE